MSGERHIPATRSEVVELCATDPTLPTDPETFRAFARLLSATFHHEFHERLEELKESFRPFDRSVPARRPADDPGAREEREELGRRLAEGLRSLVEDANFEPVTDEGLAAALREESIFRVRLHVDFDDFEEILFFRRGGTRRTETLRRWGGLRTEEIEFVSYEHVVVYVRFRPRASK